MLHSKFKSLLALEQDPISQTTTEQKQICEYARASSQVSPRSVGTLVYTYFFFPKEKLLLGCETLKSLPSRENQAPFVRSTMWTSLSPCDWEEARMGGLEIIPFLLVEHPWEIVEDF